MIVTTSRYASRATREYAKRTAAESRGRYVSRGKKTVHALAEFSWKAGHGRLVIIEELAGKPKFRSEIEIDHWGKWKWGKRHEIKG